MRFIPVVMLTEETTREELVKCKKVGINDGKMYPLLRTTKSGSGVKHYGRILPVVKWCGELDIKVHGHFEHPSLLFHNRDAEFACLPIARMFLEETEATIVWEHGTDARCIPHWEDMATSKRFFVTLTAHHLVTNEDEAFGDVRAVCKPPIKTENDRRALVVLIEKDYPWVMNGPDVAGHNESAKQVPLERCACGAYTAPFLLALYAHGLDHLLKTAEGIETFINFTSRNVRRLHNLPPASRQIKMVRQPLQIPLVYQIGSWKVMPFWAGRIIDWSIA
jgi:dihydroorotase